MEKIPVYVINGFLDSGKSSFYTYTIGQPYFQSPDRTLLILCEEGEVEYSEKLLKQSRTDMAVIDSVDEFTPAKLMALNAQYQPGRVLIEWNGMWDFRKFRLPRAWVLEQQISCIDASSFGMYFSNLAMRSLLFEELRNSELIMFNRCDDIEEEELIKYKRNVKAVCANAELIFEDKDGEIDLTTEEDLPFDINQEVIDLEGINYGVWYLDAMEHMERYEGKKVRFRAIVAKPDGFAKGYFVPGRMAMTCCAEDMQFLGYACKCDTIDSIAEKSWIQLTAEVRKEFLEQYEGEGIVLHAISAEPCEEPKDALINFAG
jgi:hypothetical protein